jgi:hypothetical protein
MGGARGLAKYATRGEVPCHTCCDGQREYTATWQCVTLRLVFRDVTSCIAKFRRNQLLPSADNNCVIFTFTPNATYSEKCESAGLRASVFLPGPNVKLHDFVQLVMNILQYTRLTFHTFSHYFYEDLL